MNTNRSTKSKTRFSMPVGAPGHDIDTYLNPRERARKEMLKRKNSTIHVYKPKDMVVKGPAGGRSLETPGRTSARPIFKKMGTVNALHPNVGDDKSMMQTERSFMDNASSVNELNRQRTRRLEERKLNVSNKNLARKRTLSRMMTMTGGLSCRSPMKKQKTSKQLVEEYV
jgi:hypothetical protein